MKMGGKLWWWCWQGETSLKNELHMVIFKGGGCESVGKGATTLENESRMLVFTNHLVHRPSHMPTVLLSTVIGQALSVLLM